VIYGRFKRAIPILKPDLIILATLQGDDVKQTMQQIEKQSEVTHDVFRVSFKSLVKATMRYLFPHSRELIKNYNAKSRTEKKLLRNTWRAQAKKLLSGYEKDQREKFEGLDHDVREMFLNGGLNPALVNIAVTNPRYFIEPLHTDSPDVQLALREMTRHFGEIQKAAQKTGTDVLVLSVPYGIYASERDLESRQRLGFSGFPGMLISSFPDEAIRVVSEKKSLPFFSVMDKFRVKAKTDNLFFEYDGHFNAKGHVVFAELLLSLFERCILSSDGISIKASKCATSTQ